VALSATQYRRQMATTKTKLNVTLLRKVMKHILEEPRRLRQSEWLAKKGDAYYKHVPRKERPPCGTVACIAGWAVELSGVEVPTSPHVSTLALNLLVKGNDYHAEDLRDKLEYQLFMYFPQGIAPSTLEYAQDVVRRTKEFIKDYA